MKNKIITIVFLMLFLSGCKNIELKERIFISSLGFDYDENNKLYEIVGFSPNMYKLASQQGVSTDITQSTVSEKGTSLPLVLKKINDTVPLQVDLDHLKTIILSENFIKDMDNLDALLKLFLYSDILHLGVYVFYTDEKIIDLFSGGLPNDVSLIYNLITNPKAELSQKKQIYNMILSSMAEDYYEPSSIIIFPWIGLNRSWGDNNEKEIKTGHLKGVATYNKKNEIVKLNKDDFLGLEYIENEDEINLDVDENSYRLFRYKVKKKFDDNKGIIEISFDLKKLIEIKKIEDEKIKIEIVKKIEELLIFCKNSGIDILKIEENLFRNKKNYRSFNLDDYEIEYRIRIN